ncbi:amino acid permease [Klenkia terrae]|jgi:L-asparagine transporter-like permease|uniref:Amino acid permease n=1 Tax=Klenkia terrae TaxID=1052259 RepID=A0ABU8E8P4_9ACTN
MSSTTDTPGTGTGSDGATGTAGLQRRLNSKQLTMIGIGGAIGTGLFLGSSLAISQAGPAVIIAYILCGLVALVIAWALAEMVVVHPTAGAFGAIAHNYLGAGTGFVLRWTYWAMQVIAIGGEMIAAGVYVKFWWPDIPLWLPVIVFSVLVLAVNAAAVHLFGSFEYWFAMIKVTAIAVFVLLGLVLVVFGLPDRPAVGTDNLLLDGGFFPNGITGLMLAMVFVLFSYIGTEVVSVTAAESENPQRDIPRAARAMVLRLGLFYVLAIMVVVLVVPWTLTAQGGTINASPFVTVFEGAGIPAAAGIMTFVVLTAALSSANTNLYLTTRMMHSLAEHRLAPAWAGRLSTSGVPRNALALSALGMVVAAILSANDSGQAYLVLFGISVFAAIVVWLLILATHASFRATRRKEGLPPSPVQLWAAPVTRSVVAVFLVAVLVSTYFVEGLDPAWQFGLPFFVLLVATYLVMKKTGRCDHLLAETRLPDYEPRATDA